MEFIHKTTLDNSIKYMGQLTEQINYNIDSYIRYMQNITYMLKYNTDVKEFLTLEYESPEQELARKRVIQQINTILRIREDIYNIGVIGMNGRSVINNDAKMNPYMNVKEKTWYKRALEKQGELVITSSHVQNIIEYQYPWVVTLSSEITNEEGNVGVLMVDLNYKVIDDLCKSVELEDRGYIFIVDEVGNLVYHPKQNLIYCGLKTEQVSEVLASEENYFVTNIDGEEYVYITLKSDVTDWRVVGVVQTEKLLTYSTLAKNTYFITTALVILIAILLSVQLSKKITKPIILLEAAMKKSELGEFEAATIQVKEKNEIGRLGRNFNIMNEKIEQLIKEKVLNEKLKRKSELRALQAQINPHFLYNTLDSIIWMAEGGKNEEVVQMTAQLARLLRQSISNEAEVVSINQEINYIKSYLSIQKMRYRDQLSYVIDIDEAIGNYKIIKLVIQPLVENAIYHGIKYKEGPGNIFVKGYEEDEKIILEIKDDGIGMDEEVLERIFERKESRRKSNGVGVHNVYSRLRLRYGQACDLVYESRVNEGTTIRVVIPKGEEDEE